MALGVAAMLALTGCTSSATLGYYWQSVSGHLEVMRAAKPVPDWLADAHTPEKLKERLRLSQRLRDFATSTLKLPDNPSYRRYADLKRRAVVWNVVAAPPYSLTLKTWCFPVTGCVGYRGYFDEAAAQAEAAQIEREEGLEVNVYGVPAYSTLGWMNWAGGDPLLNTFITYPEGELARMVFHELAHQVAFAQDDTVFNESFATAVERLGAQRWLSVHASPAARTEYESFDSLRRQFRTLTRATRQRLDDIYQEKHLFRQVIADKAAMKNEAMKDFQANYALLKAQSTTPPERWAGYDAWVARANNAAFGTLGAYDDLVDAFEALYAQEGQDWDRFYDAVKHLATLPKDERHHHLKHLLETSRG